MLRFQTVITVKEYFDQQSEGIRLDNEIVTGLDAESAENVILRKEFIKASDAATFTTNVSNYIGSSTLADVDTVHMFCAVPQQYANTSAIPIACRVTFGLKQIAYVSQWTMYGLENGLTEELTFSHIQVPADFTGDELIQFIVFINLKK
jgi:hypothetical protein